MKNLGLLMVFAMVFGVTLMSCDKHEMTVNKYTVYFNSNGGSEVLSQIVKEGEKVIKPDDPIRVNYEFLGWHKNYWSDEWLFHTDVVISDTTLYARWNQTC